MIRSRFAPTPSGYLHTGNALNFVLTWLWTRKQTGAILLRIDDLDAPRVKAEYLEDIFRTLDWLGLDWDEGPQSVEEHRKQHSQTLRNDLYSQYIETLIKSAQVFACNCSRKGLQMHEQYPGNCRQKAIPLNAPDTALRILTPEGTEIDFRNEPGEINRIKLFSEMRDFIIRRRDGIAAYQVASLADDIHYKINLVIRGSDLLSSTAAQLYLAQFFANAEFDKTIFYHHPLLKDDKGQKLSKSASSLSLKAWREQDSRPEKFYIMLSKMLGWDELAISAEEMLAAAKSGKTIIMK